MTRLIAGALAVIALVSLYAIWTAGRPHPEFPKLYDGLVGTPSQ